MEQFSEYKNIIIILRHEQWKRNEHNELDLINSKQSAAAGSKQKTVTATYNNDNNNKKKWSFV